MAIARASKASAIAGVWKLAVERISPVSTSTSGLSAAEFSSVSTASRASAKAASAVPVHLRQRAEAERVLHAPADPPCPGCFLPGRGAERGRLLLRAGGAGGGDAWRRRRAGSPRSPRRRSTATASRTSSTRRAASSASAAIAQLTAEALRSASPSFAPRATGRRPAAASASPPGAGRRGPRLAAADDDRGDARTGARSPAPTEPRDGITGVTSRCEHRHHQLVHVRRDRRAARGERDRAAEQGAARQASTGSGSPTPSDPPADRCSWNPGYRIGRQPVPDVGAQPGVQAVHGCLAGQVGIDDRPARLHPGTGLGREREANRAARCPHHVGHRQPREPSA